MVRSSFIGRRDFQYDSLVTGARPESDVERQRALDLRRSQAGDGFVLRAVRFQREGRLVDRVGEPRRPNAPLQVTERSPRMFSVWSPVTCREPGVPTTMPNCLPPAGWGDRPRVRP